LFDLSKRGALCLFAAGLMLAIGAARATSAPSTLSPEALRRTAAEVDASLHRDVLSKWFPAAVDGDGGGFFQNFGADWGRRSDGERSIVYQSRLTWVAATAAQREPAAEAKRYRSYAQHGVDFLSKRLWDVKSGGLFWAIDGRGEPWNGGEKHSYGIAFAVYAASAAYQATHDPTALDLAKRTFLWLDDHAHDAKNGGYYEALARDGQPILTSPLGSFARDDVIGTRYGRKSMNTHIHLLEAFTGLYAVWPDARVKTRLREVFDIVRGKVYNPAGYLNMFFAPDWKPVSEEDSYGHDIETAYLLTEASEALGRPDDPAVWTVARALVDHALRYGWDEKNGGFYDAGPANAAATRTFKVWWTQAEGLNALLQMHARFGRETDRYGAAFLKQWDWIKGHQIDAVHGGWYPTVSPTGEPMPGQPKSDAWTEAYHQGRALWNVAAALKRLATRPSSPKQEMRRS
jgi:mannobiose 2-epimerase